MMGEVKYINILGRELSLQQVNAVQSYEKLSYESGTLKLIESFRKVKDKLYKSYRYFLDPSEDKERIIEEYAIKTNSRLVIYFDQQPSGAYSLWNYEEYSQEGVIIFKGKQVFDNKHRTIFHCSYDLVTNELEEGAIKYFYADKVEGEYEDMLLEFRYKSNGGFDEAVDIHDNFDFFKAISLEKFLATMQYFQEDFRWDQHPYYHSAYPFLPEGPL